MKISNILFLAPLLVLTGCDRDDHDTGACADDTATTGVVCTDATGDHAVGDSWTCPDECNTCACVEDGTIISTLMACTTTSTDTGTATDTFTEVSTGTDTGTDTGTGTDTSTDTSTAG